MRPGTPGFVPARLTQAREARGMSMMNLADLLDISRESISKYERGSSTPGPEILARICEKLAMPSSFFVQPVDSSVARAPVFFRSMSSAGVSQRNRARVLHEWLHEITRSISKYVDIPEPQVPTLPIAPTIAAASNESIEEAATNVRRYWKLGDGPISDVLLLLENHGVIIARAPLELAGLDGLSGWFNNRPVILLNSDKETAVRSRMDVAHELAHLVMHRDSSAISLKSSATFKLIETQAFRFGAAFLLPARSFVVECQPLTLDHLLELKRRWRVSVALMIHRATDLQLLDADGATYMWRKYVYRGWKRQEPLDDEMSVERPRLLPRAIDLLLAGGVFTRADLPSHLHLAPHDVERLTGLPDGFLNQGPSPVVQIQPRLRPPTHEPLSGAGKVIAFKFKAAAERSSVDDTAAVQPLKD